jgi:hypothetical protein
MNQSLLTFLADFFALRFVSNNRWIGPEFEA